LRGTVGVLPQKPNIAIMTNPYIVQTKWKKPNGIFGTFVQNHKEKNIDLVSEKFNQTFGSNHRFRSSNVFNKRIFYSRHAVLNHMKYIPGAYACTTWLGINLHMKWLFESIIIKLTLNAGL